MPTAIAVSTMKAARVPRPGEQFEVVEREIPEPGAGEVRIRVRACGVCHSDALTVEGVWPGIQYPRVPGHEAAGVIDAVGAGVSGFCRRLMPLTAMNKAIAMMTKLMTTVRKLPYANTAPCFFASANVAAVTFDDSGRK